jgi:hypothetical protein
LAARLALAFSAAITAACGAPARSPADAAAFTERTRCGSDVTESDLTPVFSGHSVQSVGPLYATIEGGKSGSQSQLRGAVLTFGALPGETAEWLDRELECHNARLTLGETQSMPDDPFWLAGSAVDIDVRPTSDGLLVGVAGRCARHPRARSVFRKDQRTTRRSVREKSLSPTPFTARKKRAPTQVLR